jgi:hypothetical protein
MVPEVEVIVGKGNTVTVPVPLAVHVPTVPVTV